MAQRLVKKNTIMKYAQIALSAISTGGFIGAIITEEKALTCVGGIFSTLLLALNLFFKDFSLLDELKNHRATADKLWVVRESYISLMTDFVNLSDQEIIEKRDQLQSVVHEIYKIAPITDEKSYKEAQVALKDNEEQFFNPDELDLILPAHLRKHK